VHALGQRRGGAGADPDRRAEHLEKLRLLLLLGVGRLGEHGHVRADVGEVVGGGEARDADPDDDRVHAGPRVGAPEPVDVGGAHAPVTHSA
jgi:hypothetical protein